MRVHARVGPFELVSDTGAADWLSELAPLSYRVTSVVPPVFESYARVFHPADRYDDAGELVPVTWAAVADANQKRSHPGMEWASITGSTTYLYGGSQPGIWDSGPDRGNLPVHVARRLSSVLSPHTASSAGWFTVWEGYSALAVPSGSEIPRVGPPSRPMLLLRAPLSAATCSLGTPPFDQRASMWWPADRAWFVSTDVDLMTTYVGGNRTCIDALLADAELEVMPATADQRVSWDGDTVNPSPRDRA